MCFKLKKLFKHLLNDENTYEKKPTKFLFGTFNFSIHA